MCVLEVMLASAIVAGVKKYKSKTENDQEVKESSNAKEE